jgi:hypothetical protein
MLPLASGHAGPAGPDRSPGNATLAAVATGGSGLTAGGPLLAGESDTRGVAGGDRPLRRARLLPFDC